MTITVQNTVVIDDLGGFSLGSATPATPVTGMIRYNGGFQVYNGTAWVAIN